MTIELFDVQTGILGARPGERGVATAEDLVSTMGRIGINGALVRVAPADSEGDWAFSNRKLYEACAKHPELVPCPAVLPNTGEDFASEEEQVADALTHGAGAAWVRMEADHWIIAEWLSDRLFGALTERRVPVYIAAESLSPTGVTGLAGRFPDLAIVYAEVGYRDQRILLPLLERFGNISLSIGKNYRVQGGIEQFVGRLGAGRLLFGSGFPDAEPMGTAMQLLYADIPEDDKQQIGSGNIRRLMGEILR